MIEPANGGSRKYLYLVFDGGGARGIAHVAAWRVFDRLISALGRPQSEVLPAEFSKDRYELKGVAGTSAGAIAAALIAAGARPDDLIDRRGRIALFSELKLSKFYDMFGIAGWRRLKHLRLIGSKSRLVERALARLARQSRGERVDAPDDAISRFDAWYALLIVSALLFVGFGSLSVIAKQYFPSPLTVLYFIPLFWAALHLAYFLIAETTRQLERTARKKQLRGHWSLTRGFLHPLATFFYALGLAIGGFVLFRIFAIAVLGPDLFHQFLVEHTNLLGGFALALDGILIAVGTVALAARFIRGSVDTTELEKDLSLALNTLISKTPELLPSPEDPDARYAWNERNPQTSLGRKITDHPANDYRVKFGELYDHSQISLEMIAADVVSNKLSLLGTHTTPEMEVAKAVAASLALPLAFQPLRSDTKIWVDGGIVSAIPAWVYRKQRNHDPDCKVLAIRIEDYTYDNWMPVLLQERDKFIEQSVGSNTRYRILRQWRARLKFWRRHWTLMIRLPFAVFINTLYTAAFGARSIELDASDRLDSVVLQPKLRLADFDIRQTNLVTELNNLELKARFQIEHLLWLRERAFATACRNIENTMRNRGRANPVEDKNVHVRMFWAEMEGMTKAVRIKYTYNFLAEHLDDRIVMPPGTSMSAFAAATRQTQFAAKKVLEQLLSEKKNRYRAAVKWRDLAWCWAIPVMRSDGSMVAGVLAIESNVDLGTFDEALGVEAAARSTHWVGANEALLPADELAKIAGSSLGQLYPLMQEWESDFANYLGDTFVKFREVREATSTPS